MLCEKARNDHSKKLWKLHESLQNNPALKTRDPAMVKRLIEWEEILWPESYRDPIEVIEGSVTLEQLGEKWNSMASGERGLLLQQVNLEEYLLGHTSLGKSIGLVYQGDKYYNPSNLGKTWNKFSDEDKRKILRAYNWDFSYIYYDEQKNCDVLYSTFLDKYRSTARHIADMGDFMPSEKMVPCQECSLYLGDLEKEHSDVLGEMCLKCFREQTDQTHEWYDIPPVLKKVSTNE